MSLFGRIHKCVVNFMQLIFRVMVFGMDDDLRINFNSLVRHMLLANIVYPAALNYIQHLGFSDADWANDRRWPV